MRRSTWLAGALGVGVLASVHLRRPAPSGRDPDGGLDILHLAFEDHRRPGSGGGSVRTYEINRRLADRHRVTVVTTAYPGAHRRVEEGVTYRPLGVALGYYGSIVSYHLLTPLLVMTTRPDLVVEDFAAPMSSMLVPLWTAQPTVAIAQWLFASETSNYYGVPFFLAEALGVRLHRRFVAVSAHMAEQITSRNRRAIVDVIPAGVDLADAAADGRSNPSPSARSETIDGRAPQDHDVGGSAPPGDESAGREPTQILYLGRLQPQAKGLDLLLGAFARLPLAERDLGLTVAGVGPYRADMEALAVTLGVRHRVHFVGHVEGAVKWELLRRAAVVAVPSRYESFGLVVLEALAAGTPVVAFALPALAELLAADRGTLVACFDVPAFAAALDEIVADPARSRAMGEAGRRFAAGYSWDEAALAQERTYLAAVADGRRRWRSGRRATGPARA